MKGGIAIKLTLNHYIRFSKNKNIHLSRYFEYAKNGILILQVNSYVQLTDK